MVSTFRENTRENNYRECKPHDRLLFKMCFDKMFLRFRSPVD